MAKRRRVTRASSSKTGRESVDTSQAAARTAESLTEIATASAMEAVRIATGVARGMA